MTEDLNTKDLTTDEKLDLLLTEMRETKARLTELETRFAGRDTNPLPRNYAERFERTERQLEAIGSELRGMREDLEAERRRRFHVEDRLAALETRPS